ncbi:transcription factor [Rhodotorula toruloides]|uniref:Transcription factor n=1 Tax=Rhodotorula toruloides TaxID=5286 RepID=A0A511KR59_RHOTO|nr:transcription factor [Rhodotorula toruloides]
MPRSMNQYTQLFTAQQAPSKGSFDEAAAALSAFLDLSSLTNDAVAVTVHEQPSSTSAAFSNAFSGLRPVDDSLLDSPLDLELSPASSFATSPLDFVASGSEFTSPLLDGSFDSPLVESYPVASVACDMPSLFAPAPSGGFAGAAGGIDLAALASSIGLSLPPLPSFAPAHAPASSASSMTEDIKPVLASESTPFDVPAPESTPVQSAAQRRKSTAQIKKEAAAALEEKPFAKRDKFTGIRNTKKPPVAYDAPTLPKNYLTESATSKKRAGSAKVAASVSKRARSTSATPGLDLPEAQPEPINEDNLDDNQLAAIELKRRSNTLAARRSRARKAAYIQELKDEIERLAQLNEALQGELAQQRAKCQCQHQQAA